MITIGNVVSQAGERNSLFGKEDATRPESIDEYLIFGEYNYTESKR
jgi:hypothetical protein